MNSYIADNAFNGCEHLTKVTLHTKYQNIGASAFLDTRISEIILPATVTNIGANAFASKYQLLKDVVFKSMNPPTMGATIFGTGANGQNLIDDDKIELTHPQHDPVA